MALVLTGPKCTDCDVLAKQNALIRNSNNQMIFCDCFCTKTARDQIIPESFKRFSYVTKELA